MSRADILDMLQRQASFDTHGSAGRYAPMIGSALVGGARSKGRKCVKFTTSGTTGKKRCSKYEALGKAIAGLALGGDDMGGDDMGYGLGGVLVGGKRRSSKCAPGQMRAGPSGRIRCHKYLPLGSGCGMCGACGGVLQEAPLSGADAASRRLALRELKNAYPLAAADFCPPFDILLEGDDKLKLSELQAYVQEMQTRAPSKVLTAWRAEHKKGAQQRKAFNTLKNIIEGRPYEEEEKKGP